MSCISLFLTGSMSGAVGAGDGYMKISYVDNKAVTDALPGTGDRLLWQEFAPEEVSEIFALAYLIPAFLLRAGRRGEIQFGLQ
jgi:hypothetical protein